MCCKARAQIEKNQQSGTGIQCGIEAKGILKKMKGSLRKITVLRLTEQSVQIRMGKQRILGRVSPRKP